MVLKFGVVAILCSLALAVMVTVAVGLRGQPHALTSDSAGQQPAADEAAQENEDNRAKQKKANLGQKLEIDDEPNEDDVASRADEPREANNADDEAEAVENPEPRPESGIESQLELTSDWPEPTATQVAKARSPRYYDTPTDADMSLTIQSLGLHDVPVMSSANIEVLDRGLMHEPETSLPWTRDAQRNVFIAGHYLGWPGTASHLVFYNLDKLKKGDEIVLGGGGRVYKYRVSETFEATPEESWVMGQVQNRDMLTLQTCIPPTFQDRLLVRADRV
jgi:sortase A